MKTLRIVGAISAAILQYVTVVSSRDVFNMSITAYSSGLVESDWSSVYYSRSRPLLIGNDGGPETGGFHAWEIDGDSPLEALTSVFIGRTKLSTVAYEIGDGQDFLITIPQTTSVLTAYALPDFEEVKEARLPLLGDWSSLCTWKSNTGNVYVFLFGKHDAIQLLVQKGNDNSNVGFVEVQRFPVTMEYSGCAVSGALEKLFLVPDDGAELHSIELKETTSPPVVSVVGSTDNGITGVAVYTPGNNESSEYIFVAQDDNIDVYEYPWEHVGGLQLIGLDDVEVEGLSMYQAATPNYPYGVLAFAAEADDFAGFGFSSLHEVLENLEISANTDYTPREVPYPGKPSPIREECSMRGFSSPSNSSCACFPGSAGPHCEEITCEDNCSGHGTCIAPNLCHCEDGWGGLHCSFLLVEPSYETDASGMDGDDPAIWISPVAPELSLVVTTTKSEEGAGLNVFDLRGNLVQFMPAEQPNNVDMIYGFKAGDRVVDIAFAACRGDNTLCLFEMTANGTLKDIPGGIQPSDVEDELYGSCVYRSPKTGQQFLFVNEKSARYMQYELTSTANGTLQTTLVREFAGGSGGQVEGCVTDEDNGWILLGEEPSALWRYDAEPDGSAEGFRVARVGDGRLWGDVEGVTLVQGHTPEEGFILVSCQGVSAFNVYGRADPHEYIATFTVTDSADGSVDHVSNTDGLAAVGVRLNDDFPFGLVVVHDDVNELPEGGAHAEASYKYVSLEKILGIEAFERLRLLGQIDQSWDPRAI